MGTVQLVFQCSRMFGRRLCSLPYLDGSGILADDAAAEAALAAVCRSLMHSRRASCVELRQYRARRRTCRCGGTRWR